MGGADDGPHQPPGSHHPHRRDDAGGIDVRSRQFRRCRLRSPLGGRRPECRHRRLGVADVRIPPGRLLGADPRHDRGVARLAHRAAALVPRRPARAAHPRVRWILPPVPRRHSGSGRDVQGALGRSDRVPRVERAGAARRARRLRRDPRHRRPEAPSRGATDRGVGSARSDEDAPRLGRDGACSGARRGARLRPRRSQRDGGLRLLPRPGDVCQGVAGCRRGDELRHPRQGPAPGRGVDHHLGGIGAKSRSGDLDPRRARR